MDAANFEISLKACGLRVSYRKLLAWAKAQGKLVMLGYYSPSFGTRGQNRFFSFIKNLGFKIVTKNIKVIRQREKRAKHKANFDVEIAFDAAANIGRFDKLILFSGDSDFTYMVKQLQRRDATVTVVSPQWRTGKELRNQADEFVDLRNCEFAIKKPPFGGAHDSLSTAQRVYQEKARKSRRR